MVCSGQIYIEEPTRQADSQSRSGQENPPARLARDDLSPLTHEAGQHCGDKERGELGKDFQRAGLLKSRRELVIIQHSAAAQFLDGSKKAPAQSQVCHQHQKYRGSGEEQKADRQLLVPRLRDQPDSQWSKPNQDQPQATRQCRRKPDPGHFPLERGLGGPVGHVHILRQRNLNTYH